jgi:hypothetical protein
MFAPAWAVWDFYFGYYCWRPYSLWDWYYYGLNPYYYFSGYGFFSQGGLWTYNWPYYWTVDRTGIPGSSSRPLLTKISKSQLKKTLSASVPMPKELKGAYKLAVAALKRGDVNALESLKHVPRSLVFVQEKELNATRVHEKALTWDAVPKHSLRGGEDYSFERRGELARKALSSFRALEYRKGGDGSRLSVISVPGGQTTEGPAAVSGGTAGTRARSGENAAGRFRGGIRPSQAQGAARFRDWNPDIRVAQRLGVRILYSSETNQVVCPQLNLKSRDVVESRVRMTSRGIDHSWSGSSFSDTGGQASSSVNSRGETPASHNSSPPQRNEERSGGEKTKKD